MNLLNAIGSTWKTFTTLVDIGFKLVLGFLLLGFGLGLILMTGTFIYHLIKG